MSLSIRVEDIYVTPEEYLAAERVSETRHEYLAGVVYSMAGGSRTHGRIGSNIIIALGARFSSGPCFPFGPNVRVRIRKPGATFYYYPDVSVDCTGSRQDEIEEPTVIFEVLSPETDRADRGDKRYNYQSIPSMRVYVLVDQFRAAVTIYRRQPSGDWEMEFVGDPQGTITLPEIGCELPLTEIYRGVF